jgi:hypothetical protein
VRDFLGTPINPRCWVAVGGTGNRNAEYGMILHRVLGTEDGKIQTLRLRVDYHTGKAVVEAKKVTITKGTKVVVVKPPEKVVALFDRIERSDATQKDFDLVGKWLHGQTEDLFA